MTTASNVSAMREGPEDRAGARYAPARSSSPSRSGHEKTGHLGRSFLEKAAVGSMPGAGILVRLLPILVLRVAHIALLVGLGLLGAVLLVLPRLVLGLVRLWLAQVLVLAIHLIAHFNFSE